MHKHGLSAFRLENGLAAIASGKYQEVHAKAVGMIKKDIADAVPYCLLGMIASDHGNHLKACELFQKAARLNPQQAHYHAFLGQVLTTIGQQTKAKESADTAASLPIDGAHIADTVGVIYSRTGYHEKAISFFKKAVALNSSPANFHYNLAASYQFLGDFRNAELAYNETLKRDPKAYRAWSSLIGLERQTDESNHLHKLEELFDELSEDADAALHLGHAIAKTLEDLNRYEESLDWLHKAKRLKQAQTRGQSLTGRSLFDSAKNTVASIKNSTHPTHTGETASDTSIFIIGLPRTGTTLVDRILSSHSKVISAGELNVFPGLIKEACATRSNMVLDPETLRAAVELDLKNVGQLYKNSTKELKRGAEKMIDKMPLNFFYAGLIHRALPDARIIALRRGAMDSCLSNYRQLLTVQHSYYHYTYNLEETATFYRLFDELMSHWHSKIPSNRFMQIYYEDIVFDQETQTRDLLDFCGLEWEEECLRFHENTAPVSTASSVQVRQPLYSGSIGRWKRYGDKLDVLKSSLGGLAIEKVRD